MKVFNRTTTNRLKGLAVATAIILPLSAGLSGAVQAAGLCSPLQVTHFRIFDGRTIKQGATIVGVQFRVVTTAINTNRTRGHSGRASDFTSANMHVAPHSQSKGTQPLGSSRYPEGVGVGGRVVFVSDKVTVMRDPGNLADFFVNLKGFVHNSECGAGRSNSMSVFKYDLNPMLQGQSPRRVSARIVGYQERRAPRPGTGAPRPRS